MAYKVQTRFGYMNLDKRKPSDAAYYGFLFFTVFWLLIGLGLFAVGFVVWNIMPFLFGLFCTVMGIGYLLIARKYRSIWWEHKNQYELDKDEKQKIRFYNECKNQGVLHMQSPAYRKKATLIAQQLGIQTTDAVSLFNEAYKVVESKRVDALKRSEREAHAALTRYSEYVGHDKKISMLQDMITVKNNEIHELLAPAVGAESAKKSEQDWTIHGGIASGIAGPVAGLAAAVRVSQRNADIRQNNAKLTELQFQYMGVVAGDISRLKKQIKDMESEISSHRMKVISETSQAQIMNNLTITLKESMVSESGALFVKTSVHCNSPIRIYNELNGVIDGTIAADIYQGKQLVATALLSLPLEGVGNKPVIAEGIALSGVNRMKGYKIKFRAHHLWEIEQ